MAKPKFEDKLLYSSRRSSILYDMLNFRCKILSGHPTLKCRGRYPDPIPVSRRLDPRPVLEEDTRLVQAAVRARQVQRGQPLLVSDLKWVSVIQKESYLCTLLRFCTLLCK